MAGKIKVIIKRPGEEYGHVTNISFSLENLQRTVGGPIEVLRGSKFVIICNEESRRLAENFMIIRNKAGRPEKDMIHGTVIIAGTDGDDFADVPISFADWKKQLMTWEASLWFIS